MDVKRIEEIRERFEKAKERFETALFSTEKLDEWQEHDSQADMELAIDYVTAILTKLSERERALREICDECSIEKVGECIEVGIGNWEVAALECPHLAAYLKETSALDSAKTEEVEG